MKSPLRIQSQTIIHILRTICLFIEAVMFVRGLIRGMNPWIMTFCIAVAAVYAYLPSPTWQAARALDQRLRPLQIGVCPPERYPELDELFQKNEAQGLLPAKDRVHYSETLRQNHLTTFIAEMEGTLVGTFGLQYSMQWGSTVLCYLLVDPGMQRQGVGTTLILASLAMIPGQYRNCGLLIFGLSTAEAFYTRLDFVRIAEYTGADGRMQFVGRLPVFPESCVAARVRLKRAGALLPDHPLDIPAIAPPPAQELPPENASPSMGNSS